MSIERLSQAAAQTVIRGAAQATGADFGYLLNAAQRESSLAPGAKAATSSAAGLFQFIESTWLRVLDRHGEKHGAGQAVADARSGDPRGRARALDQRFDPVLAAKLAGELTNENAQFLSDKLGRAPSGGELYAAHVLGPAGAAKLVQAAERQEASAAVLFPAAAKANHALFHGKDGAPLSPAALLRKLGSEVPAQTQNHGASEPDRATQAIPGLTAAGLADGGWEGLLARQWAEGALDLEPLQRAARAYLEHARQNFVNRNGGHSEKGSDSHGSN